jgi:branched-chain amino acid transport system permease protein
MPTLFGVPLAALFGQVVLGCVNGAFYAMLSLGLALIFGLLNVINFAHGAFYMMGAFAAWLLLGYAGVGYWGSLILAPLIIAAIAAVVERLLLSKLYKLDHLYGLLLTFGLALLFEGIFRQMFGVSGLPYAVPKELQGVWNLGFMVLPIYRGWVVGVSVVVCVGIWALIEKTKLGAVLRAATENPSLLAAFGVNVPILMTATFCLGAGLAGLSGVLAAPIYSVNPLMGSNLIIVVFAVVVIGGMGSIMGAVITGFSLGLIEGLCKVFVPQITATAVFVIMAIVLLVRPAGLFGKRS